jgi:uncharacterized protein (TIGR00106 family)
VKAVAEIQVIPIGVGVSLRKEVALAHKVIEESGLKVELHGFGTNVEGDLATILATVQKIHERLHEEGIARISSAIKLGTRQDKDYSLAGKVKSVQEAKKSL